MNSGAYVRIDKTGEGGRRTQSRGVRDEAVRPARREHPERFSTFSNIDGAASFYRGRFDTPDSAVLVAEIENEVVGFAYVERDELNYAALLRNGAWLHDIYVDAPERGKGLGKALIGAAIQAAKQMGADKMLLTVAANNLAAQRIFGDAGFRPTMTEMTLNLPDRS